MLNSKVGKEAKLLADTLFMGKSVRHLGGVCVLRGCLRICSPFGKTPRINTWRSECLVSPKKQWGVKGGELGG